MNRHINRHFDTRYNLTQGATEGKTIVDLALGAYNSEVSSTAKRQGQLDYVFRRYATCQVIVFVFARHETPSTTMCYAWLPLSQNPEAMAKMCTEHDKVFEPEPKAASLLAENPGLHGQLTYTPAVIKESLRLFPFVSSSRQRVQDFVLTDSQARTFPTEHCLV
jgi:hypothetical protein